MITPDTVSQGLMQFFLIGAILLLALAILVYPSLNDHSKKSSK